MDAKDQRILQELIRDARVSMARLGRRVRLSRQAVASRVDRLVAEGTIRSFETRINYARLGFEHFEVWCSFRNLGVERDAIIAFFVEHPFVRWVGECITTYNLRVTFIALDDRHMERLVGEVYARFGDAIDALDVLTITDVAKQVPYDLPSEEYVEAHIASERRDVYSPDRLDIDLLELLSHDPRRRYSEMAEHVGLTLEGVRQRVRRLEAAGVIEGYSANVDPHAINTFWMILLVRFGSLDLAFKRRLLAYTQERSFTGRAYVLLGAWHYHMTLNGESLQELASHIRDFESQFAGNIKQYLPVLVTESFKYPKLPAGVFEALRIRTETNQKQEP